MLKATVEWFYIDLSNISCSIVFSHFQTFSGDFPDISALKVPLKTTAEEARMMKPSAAGRGVAIY